LDSREELQGPHLLAALVLSGQWVQAHRCCERMVAKGRLGATGLRRSHRFFGSS
jgi:hypothetical protein